MMKSLSAEVITALKGLAAFAVVTGLALGFRHLALRALYRWAARTPTRLDDVLVRSLRLPSAVWCVLIGLYVALDLAPLPPRPGAAALSIVYALLVVSATAALANVAASTLWDTLRKNNLALPATGLSITIIKVTIWIVGGLVLLSGLGVSIAPILTALGVGGLAVALALQDTLSNFFAGIHLLIEKPVRIGDFVKLETGQEGYIVDIGWRTTRIRMLPNNLVIIPNNKLTQSILTNYFLPDPRMAVSLTVSVSYGTDPDRVERVLLEEAQKAVGQVPGLLAEPAPAVRLIPGFGESSLDFTLGVHVREFEDQGLVQHELRKRILKRFKDEQIEMPYPQQVVQLKTDKPTEQI
jgi:small-conductance mechanosensitive channel